MRGGLPEAVTRPSLGRRRCSVFGLQWWLPNCAHLSGGTFETYAFCLYVKQENVECPETEWNGGYQQVAMSVTGGFSQDSHLDRRTD